LGDAEWFAQSAGRARPTVRGANRQSSIRNHQSQAVYEYDVYGQVAASDPNHPNRFLFTGREFDTETGLYYYRARYYNPTIGRFLQTDPIGYADGMGMYAYCGNSPLGCADPSGCKTEEEASGKKGISLGFYGPTEQTPKTLADDFDVPYPLTSSAFELTCLIQPIWEAYLLGLYGVATVSDVYIYDHGISESPTDPTMVGIGAGPYQYVDPSRSEVPFGACDLEDACRIIATIVEDYDLNITIHLRGCHLADADGIDNNGDPDLDLLMHIAEWTGCTVTGCTGNVTYVGSEWDGPDYVMWGDLWQVSPDGTSKLLWAFGSEEPQPY